MTIPEAIQALLDAGLLIHVGDDGGRRVYELTHEGRVLWIRAGGICADGHLLEGEVQGALSAIGRRAGQ